MREFKIETDLSSERRETLLFWAALLSPIIIAALIVFIVPLIQTGYRPFRWLLPLFTMGALIGAYIIAFRTGMQRANRRMIFALNDKEFVRKRNGWPDDRIAFSEISALYERPRGLVVESAVPLRRISIPREVNGFEAIRGELVKHHPFSLQANPPRAELTWTRLISMIVAILSWSAIIFIFYKAMRPR